MKKSSDPSKKAAAIELEYALRDGNVKYLVAEQKLTSSGDLGEFRVKEFDF